MFYVTEHNTLGGSWICTH